MGVLDRLCAGHPLAPVLPLLRRTLVEIADETAHVLILTDGRGLVLCRLGERGPFGPAEHGARTRHPWTPAAAPIHDPDTGDLIGALDVDEPSLTVHPTTSALVAAAAGLAERHLAAHSAARDGRLLVRGLAHLRDEPAAVLAANGRVLAARPAGWLPARIALPAGGDRVRFDGGEGVLEPLSGGWLLRSVRATATALPVLTVPVLGAERPVVHVDGRPVRLPLRLAELLTVLVLHPDGSTAAELATLLHGDPDAARTVRADVHRLRAHLPMIVPRTPPYRLRARVDADFRSVRDALLVGRVREAALAYRGPLLPASTAPAVRDEREQLACAVRAAVLGSGDVDAMWALARTAADPELLRHLEQRLPRRDPRRVALAAQLVPDA
ncbi:transcriptional regulator [Pseudonocardia sp. CA-107938]|uniref:transcriptional regulator n=1 Tax=Pseudonocardia sp. CA-107938 TaxID=3240021 RepID=UPI003D8C1CB1